MITFWRRFKLWCAMVAIFLGGCASMPVADMSRAVSQPRAFCAERPVSKFGGRVESPQGGVCWAIDCPAHTLTLGWDCE